MPQISSDAFANPPGVVGAEFVRVLLACLICSLSMLTAFPESQIEIGHPDGNQFYCVSSVTVALGDRPNEMLHVSSNGNIGSFIASSICLEEFL